MAVNPPMAGEMTLAAYKSAAAKVGNSTTPFQSARGGIISQGATASSAGTGTSGGKNGTATGTGARSTSTKNGAVENSPLGWGMWTVIAGAAAFGAVAL